MHQIVVVYRKLLQVVAVCLQAKKPGESSSMLHQVLSDGNMFQKVEVESIRQVQLNGAG